MKNLWNGYPNYYIVYGARNLRKQRNYIQKYDFISFRQTIIIFNLFRNTKNQMNF